MDSDWNDGKRRQRGLTSVLLALGLLVFAASCGPDATLESPDRSDDLAAWFDGEPLQANGRYFPAPTREFFDDPRITAVDPDPEERLPMILSSRTYWMPDEHAMTITHHSNERMIFPLRGNEPLLAYKPGHLILNKWFVMRHEIRNVEVTDTHIIWDVRPADIEEVILQASFYLHIEPETPYPFAFDPMDVYLYESREHQLEVIREIGLNYGLLNPANIKRLERGEPIQLSPQAELLRDQRLGIDTSQREELVRSRRQATQLPNQCEILSQPPSDWVGDPDDYGVADRLFACDEWASSNFDLLRAKAPTGGATEANHSQCDTSLNPNSSELCLCGHPDSDDQCISRFCDDVCLFGEQPCSSDSECPGDQVCSFDVLMTENCPDDDVGCQEDLFPCTSGENGQTRNSNSEICVLSESDGVHAWHVNPGTCGDAFDQGVDSGTGGCEVDEDCPDGFFCNAMNSCENDDFQFGFPMGGGLAFCLNTDVLPADACPFGAAAGGDGDDDGESSGQWGEDIDWPQFEWESRFAAINCGIDGGEIGGGGAALRASCGLELGPSLFQLAIYPIFMAAVGIKAKFKVKFWRPKVELRVGIYAGVGYGFSAGLFLANIGGSASDSKQIYWSDIGKSAFGPIPVVILKLELDPYVRVDYFIQSGIGGNLVYDYYKEHWFYACLRVGTSGAKFDTGDKARRRCGLPNMDDRPQYDGWRETRLHAELQLGLVVSLGLELRLYKGSKRTGIWFEPVRAIADFAISLRAPLCAWSFDLRFGGLFGFGIKIPIVGRISHEWRWRWPIPRPIHMSGIFNGGFWTTFFGCYAQNFGSPFEGDIRECDDDNVCIDNYVKQGPQARCFARECVDHDALRFSLGWNTPFDESENGVEDVKGASLALFIKDPSGSIHHGGADSLNVFYRHDTGFGGNNGRHIVNAAFPERLDGDYEFWVAVTNMEDVLSADYLPDQIQYTVEVEVDGQMGTRQQFTGTIDLLYGSTTPTIFSLCTSPDDGQFCSENGFCGRIREYDQCGNLREIDCGFCSLGAWQQQGSASAGDWQVSSDDRSVFQSINGQPTMYVSNQDFMNTRLKGTFRVESVSGWNDDDFIGFVFGYNGPLGSNHQAWDTMVLSWKQQDQGAGKDGFALGYANGAPPNWGFTPSGNLEVFDTNYGVSPTPLVSNGLSYVRGANGKGWLYNTDYLMELIYEPHRIQIFVCIHPDVDDPEAVCGASDRVFDVPVTETSFTEFPPGRFGFYNFSQPNVRYSNFIAYPLDLD